MPVYRTIIVPSHNMQFNVMDKLHPTTSPFATPDIDSVEAFARLLPNGLYLNSFSRFYTAFYRSDIIWPLPETNLSPAEQRHIWPALKQVWPEHNITLVTMSPFIVHIDMPMFTVNPESFDLVPFILHPGAQLVDLMCSEAFKFEHTFLEDETPRMLVEYSELLCTQDSRADKIEQELSERLHAFGYTLIEEELHKIAAYLRPRMKGHSWDDIRTLSNCIREATEAVIARRQEGGE